MALFRTSLSIGARIDEFCDKAAEGGGVHRSGVAAHLAAEGGEFERAWQFHQALAAESTAWRPRPPATADKIWNKELEKKLSYLDRVFRLDESGVTVDDPGPVPAESPAGAAGTTHRRPEPPSKEYSP